MSKIIFALMLLAPFTSSAQTNIWLDTNVYTNHENSLYISKDRDSNFTTHNFNDNNAGLTLSYHDHDRDEIEYKVGVFKNSYNKTSTYGALNFRLWNFYPSDSLSLTITPGLLIGVASGYPDIRNGYIQENTSGLKMVGMTNISVELNKVRAVIGYLPSKDSDVFSLQLGVRF